MLYAIGAVLALSSISAILTSAITFRLLSDRLEKVEYNTEGVGYVVPHTAWRGLGSVNELGLKARPIHGEKCAMSARFAYHGTLVAAATITAYKKGGEKMLDTETSLDGGFAIELDSPCDEIDKIAIEGKR